QFDRQRATLCGNRAASLDACGCRLDAAAARIIRATASRAAASRRIGCCGRRLAEEIPLAELTSQPTADEGIAFRFDPLCDELDATFEDQGRQGADDLLAGFVLPDAANQGLVQLDVIG